jgi:lysyl-tRNA synthetase class II
MVALPAWAQRGPGRFYDPHKVITVQGKVEKVETLSRPGRMAGDDRPGQQAQMVSLKTDQGTMQVHLGPVKFLEQQQFTPKVGDSLTVTGSKLTTGKGEVILAAEVKSGSKSLTLRDAQGMPVWRGQGLGGRQRMLVPSAPAPVQPQ